MDSIGRKYPSSGAHQGGAGYTPLQIDARLQTYLFKTVIPELTQIRSGVSEGPFTQFLAAAESALRELQGRLTQQRLDDAYYNLRRASEVRLPPKLQNRREAAERLFTALHRELLEHVERAVEYTPLTASPALVGVWRHLASLTPAVALLSDRLGTPEKPPTRASLRAALAMTRWVSLSVPAGIARERWNQLVGLIESEIGLSTSGVGDAAAAQKAAEPLLAEARKLLDSLTGQHNGALARVHPTVPGAVQRLSSGVGSSGFPSRLSLERALGAAAPLVYSLSQGAPTQAALLRDAGCLLAVVLEALPKP